MTKSRAARAVAVIAALGIGITACSSSKSNASSAATGTTKAGSTAAPASGSGFCKVEADSLKKAQSDRATSAGTSAAALRTRYTTLRQTEQPAIDSAPGELKPDLNLLLDASVTYGKELAKVDYDVRRVPATAAAAFSSAPVQAASTRVLTYLKQQCRIDFTAGSTTPKSAP